MKTEYEKWIDEELEKRGVLDQCDKDIDYDQKTELLHCLMTLPCLMQHASFNEMIHNKWTAEEMRAWRHKVIKTINQI